MQEWSNEELSDIILTYGETLCNAAAAQRRYGEKYPRRRLPNARTFIAVNRRLRETGSARASGHAAGGRRLDIDEDVLDSVVENPRISTRRIAARLNASRSTVHRILQRERLHPFHLQPVQSLQPQDHAARLQYCQWFLHQSADNPAFCSTVLFTDEASFTRRGVFNFHNEHVWAYVNPHVVRETHFQHEFSLNIWAGIVGDMLIGPHILPNRLNGASYRAFLENDLLDLLDDVPLDIRHIMWYMHDGAPAHFSRAAREYLNVIYPRRWIGRGGPVPWPARSPDLNPLDYYLWGHLKACVYASDVANNDELWLRVQNACQAVRANPGVLERVRQSHMRRLQACVDIRGSNFEHLL